MFHQSVNTWWLIRPSKTKKITTLRSHEYLLIKQQFKNIVYCVLGMPSKKHIPFQCLKIISGVSLVISPCLLDLV